jgi:hypothetical protein
MLGLRLLALSLLILVVSVNSYRFSSRSTRGHSSCKIMAMKMSMGHQTPPIQKNNLNKWIAGLLLPMTFAINPIDLMQHSSSLSQQSFIPMAKAEFRQQQKKTYFRFIPKLKTGLGYYATDLKQAIDKQDYATISKFFEVYVSKYNKNDPNQVDATDTYVNNYLYRPMTVFAGTFAERGKFTALVDCKHIETSMM